MNKLQIKKALLLTIGLCLSGLIVLARSGGGGGGHGGGGHSGGGGGHGGGFGGGGFGGGGDFGIGTIIFIIIIIIVISRLSKAKGAGGGGVIGSIFDDGSQDNQVRFTEPPMQALPFPEGLTKEKVVTSFMEMQKAWQAQDLSKVRKWISDGVYQRYIAQFAMMKQLNQKNYLSDIRIYDIVVTNVSDDGNYTTADVAISFSMNDEFVSDKYPAFNESFMGDSDTEYWTYIKRSDAKAHNTDLYHTNNCPNCGASLENVLGEVSRCTSCNTLTNNAEFDWILSEVTQVDYYSTSSKNTLLDDVTLLELVKNDPLFSIQRMEDIASNVFMQIMDVMTENNTKKLSRFATPEIATKILEMKANMGSFVFDRLYLNDVTLSNYDTDDDKLNLSFDMTATYQRVQIGDRLRMLDSEMTTHQFSIVLSKDLAALSKPVKEIAFSFECANCGAPYNDTTNDTCTYCDASVVDTSKNWVLTRFKAY